MQKLGQSHGDMWGRVYSPDLVNIARSVYSQKVWFAYGFPFVILDVATCQLEGLRLLP